MQFRSASKCRRRAVYGSLNYISCRACTTDIYCLSKRPTGVSRAIFTVHLMSLILILEFKTTRAQFRHKEREIIYIYTFDTELYI